jgi:hypothetical protein
MRAQELLLKIHGRNIYDGFEPTHYPDDVQGWNSNHPLLTEVISRTQPKIVAEVGVWKGASTIFMAEQLRRTNTPAAIIAIDTFLGSLAHLTTPEYRSSIQGVAGWPNLYFVFLANVVRRNLQDYVCPFPQTAETAGQFLRHINIQPDLVHIDAAHDYESVMRNITDYFALLKPGGCLIGDDFTTNWPEVVWAATEFAKKNGLRLQQLDGKFLIQK